MLSEENGQVNMYALIQPLFPTKCQVFFIVEIFMLSLTGYMPNAHYSPEYVNLSMTDGCGYVYFPQQYNLSPITKGSFPKIKKM